MLPHMPLARRERRALLFASPQCEMFLGYICCLLPHHFHLLWGDGSLVCEFTRGCNGAGGRVRRGRGGSLERGRTTRFSGTHTHPSIHTSIHTYIHTHTYVPGVDKKVTGAYAPPLIISLYTYTHICIFISDDNKLLVKT